MATGRLGRVLGILILVSSAEVPAQGVGSGLARTTAPATTTTDLVATTDPTPLPLTPEVRSGFPIASAALYGNAPADYDGDGYADLSVKENGVWKIDYQRNGFGSWDLVLPGYGGLESVPVPGDYDGDGIDDLAIKIDGAGKWSIDYAANGFGTWDVADLNGGLVHWLPAQADYDGDGKTDIAIVARTPIIPGVSTLGEWRIDFARNGFGSWDERLYTPADGARDVIPADYDGDGRADPAIKDDLGNLRIDFSSNGFDTHHDIVRPGYGLSDSDAMAGDFDGDALADVAVKDAAGNWRIDYAVDGFGAFDHSIPGTGGTTARAVPADYDGDGIDDLAVRVDCSGWFIDYSRLPARSSLVRFAGWQRRFDHMSATGVVTVSDRTTLASTLVSGFQGTLFFPTSALDISLYGGQYTVQSCVSLVGIRQGPGVGALLRDADNRQNPYDHEPRSLFRIHGHDVRIAGLRLKGPEDGSRSSSQHSVTGLRIDVDPRLGLGGNVTIENNELFDWTAAAVLVEGRTPHVDVSELPPDRSAMTPSQRGLIRIARNAIHHNRRDGLGYGVKVDAGAHALIEGNVFDANRHAVASDGAPHTGYEARYNYVLEGGYTEGPGYWNQHFDVHGTGDGYYGGTGGEFYDVHHNTIRGDQGYFGTRTRAALLVRGTPTSAIHFRDNIAVHETVDAAVQLKDGDLDLAIEDIHRVHAWGNAFGQDPSSELSVGDFDADGIDDVFLATGNAWWYSSGGRTAWQFLRSSGIGRASLRMGNFDASPGTDVFWQQGTTWYFSSGGVGEPTVLQTGRSEALSDLLFGDFDGNGRTDVLWTSGTSWFLSPDARYPFARKIESNAKAASLLVGRFDANASDDVMGIAFGQWSVSFGAATSWQRLAPALSANVASLCVGDFDGDGRDDLAQRSGDGWRYWRNGTTVWSALRGSGQQPQYAEPRALWIGRFDADRRDDVLAMESLALAGIPGRPIFVGWNGSQDAFVPWSGVSMR